jgi:predicted dehydrogenase
MSAHIFHIPFISSNPSLTLHAIVQRSPKPGASAAEDYPTLKHYTTTDALFADADVDVVVVGTTPDSHFALTKAALEAGKHVLVEKPFVPTSAEADTLTALAREKGRVLCVYQNRRWDLDFLTVRKLIADDTLGRLVEFETHFDRFRADKPETWKGMLGMNGGGGVLYDLGTHLVDQVFVLFGMPTGVSAKFLNQREGRMVTGTGGIDDEPDSVSLVLSYADTGLLVYVRVGVMSVEARQPRYWIRGTKGSFLKHCLDPQEDQLKAGMKASDPAFGFEDADKAGTLCVIGAGGVVEQKTFPPVEPETYRKFYELFANSLETGREEDVPVPGAQAAMVLRILEAARESVKTGAEVKP